MFCKVKRTVTLAQFLLLVSICDGIEVKEIFKWSYINYTWPNQLTYQYHLQTKRYIPENNFPSSIKIQSDRVYMGLGRYFPGTPVTLGYVKIKDGRTEPLVTPYPSWDMNVKSGCETLQNVNAFDIDRNKIMWILDGLRQNKLTSCPAKLLLYNMTSQRVILSYDFPTEGDTNGAYLGQLVVDGNFAYITDSNSLDPGIIVYSKNKNKSWKLRDASMFPDDTGLIFNIAKPKITYRQGVGPITISPPSSNSKKTRFIFYSPVSSWKVYKLNVQVIQNIDIVMNGSWRDYVHLSGTKVDQSYNYAMDNNGDLYFCLLNKNALAKWNVDKEFRTASFVVQNNNLLNWCTGSSITSDYLYIMSGNLGNYLITDEKPTLRKNAFRLIRVQIRNKKTR